MIEAWMLADAAEEILSVLLLTVAAKALFEKSILLDRITLVLLAVCGVSDLVFCCMIDENAFLGMNLLSNLPFVFILLIFLRGGAKQLLKRLRAFADAFVIFFVPSGFVCSSVTVLLFPQNLDENGQVVLESISMAIAGLQVLVTVYLYFELLRKRLALQFRFGARFLLIVYAILITAIDLYFETVGSTATVDLPMTVKYFLAIGIVIIYFAAPLLMIKTKLSTIYETEHKMQQKLILSELKHFEQYRENQEATRQFRHDMINNLRTIQMLQKNGKNEEAQAYVDELLGTVSALSPKVVTGCDLLDCIVSSKLEEMEKAGIRYSVDGVLDRGLNISPVDICTIFANALDNAIEACARVGEDKIFRMKMKRTAAFYCITLENTVQENADPIKWPEQKHYTTKQDPSRHGFGLNNMKEAIEKNNGQMTVERKEGMFILTIMLPIGT